jgi:hypothetical protein
VSGHSNPPGFEKDWGTHLTQRTSSLSVKEKDQKEEYVSMLNNQDPRKRSLGDRPSSRPMIPRPGQQQEEHQDHEDKPKNQEAIDLNLIKGII